MDSNTSTLPSTLDDASAAEWAPKGLSGKHLTMCEYHLAGFTNREIGAVLGMHELSVGNILRSQAAKQYIQTRIDDMSEKLHAQFGQVVENMKEGLSHASIDVRRSFTDMWFKAHGRYNPKSAAKDGPITAEDVVAKLLESAKNVQVNIDNRKYEGPPPADDDFSFLGRDK
jgi:hypothetical protein